MPTRLAFGLLGFLLASPSLSFGQTTEVVNVPEMVMASRLLTYPTPSVSKPPLASHCSNALAMVNVTVSTDGTVSDVEFASGFEELQKPAMEAVKHWTYKPYIVKGKVVPISTKASIFYLGDGSAQPMFLPDGKGGVKGGMSLPLPADCGSGPTIRREP